MSKRERHEGYSVPLQSKRPYYGDVRPGQEYVEPRLYQQPNWADQDAEGQQGTDFSSWTEAEIKEFLDVRGGDYDDCTTTEQLIERARETEINTGPARKPGSAAATAAGGGGDDEEGYDPDEAYDPMAAAEAAVGQVKVPPPSAAAAAAPAAADGGGQAAAGQEEQAGGAEEEEYDPLEAFMAEINQEVAANKPNKPAGAAAHDALACDEVADPAVEYMAVRATRGSNSAAAIAADVAAAGYDSDEEVYATAKALQANAEGGVDEDDVSAVAAAAAAKRNIDPLAPVDHSLIEYDDFAKDFYTENPVIAGMTDEQVREYRRELQVHVSGFDPPRPIKTFGQAGFDHLLLGAIKKAGYDQPTAIQAQALPAVLSGRDVLGLAKTGSGKTAAFVLPMLVHIMDQPELAKGAGPIGLVLAPTRELAEQIHKETRKFSKPYGLRVVAAFGGLSKFEQFKELKAGAEVAVATPGRMMDLLRMKACNSSRVTYLVLDEADRMFDMGFEQQVRSLLGVVRPDRQTVLFSATLPRRIEALVAHALSNPVRISVGQLGAANQDVTQRVHLLKDDAAKLAWLTERLPGFIDDGDVLVFVGQRTKVEEVTAALGTAGFKAGAIHGDMDQFTRMGVLDAFRSGKHHLLVATDVAARGLDIKSIKTVINFDSARDIDTHIHRVGRTGRAGDKEGVAVTLLLEGSNKDSHFAGLLVNSLTLGGQEVPRDLYTLAMKDGRFSRGNSRGKGGKHGRRKGPPVGGAGLGFAVTPKPQQEPPGLSRGGGGFVQLPGFSKSTDDYEHESSAAAATPAAAPRPGSGSHMQQQQQQAPWSGMDFPPPPPMPAEAPPASAAGAAGQQQQQQEPLPPLPLPPPLPAAPPPPLPPGPPPPAATPAAGVQAHGAAPVPAALPVAAAAAAEEAEEADDGTMASARKQLMHSAYNSRLKSSFVSGGLKGGDIGQAATIMAPKAPGSSSGNSITITAPGRGISGSGISISAPAGGNRPAFRPPVPVTQRPMYLTRPKETITRGPRGGGGAAHPFQQQQPGAAAALQSAAAQQAIAAAQAVAARLAAQAAGLPVAATVAAPAPAAAAGGYAQPPYPPQQQLQQQQPSYYQPPQQAGSGAVDPIAAANAIAARLAAQHGHHE